MYLTTISSTEVLLFQLQESTLDVPQRIEGLEMGVICSGQLSLVWTSYGACRHTGTMLPCLFVVHMR